MRDDFASTIEAYLLHLRALGRSRETIKLRRAQLYRFARDVGRRRPTLVTLDDVELWMAGQNWKPSTRASHRDAVRTYFAFLVRKGLIDESPVHELQTGPATGPNPRPVPESAYRFAVQIADPRDRLMVRLAGEAGLRRGEVARVHTRDLIEDLLGWSLIVHGKGGKERTVPLKDDLAVELLEAPPGFLFPGAIDGHLSPAYVAKRVRRLLPASYSMHKLRHRFGSKAYAVSGDLAAVQDLLGHESPVTTRIYVKVPDGPKRAIVEAV